MRGLVAGWAAMDLFSHVGHFSPRGLLLSPDPGGWGAGPRVDCPRLGGLARREGARESLVFAV